MWKCKLWKWHFLVQIILLDFFALNIYVWVSFTEPNFALKLVVFSQNYLAFGHEHKGRAKKFQQLLMMWDKEQRVLWPFFLKKYVTKTCENAHNISWPILICKTICHFPFIFCFEGYNTIQIFCWRLGIMMKSGTRKPKIPNSYFNFL